MDLYILKGFDCLPLPQANSAARRIRRPDFIQFRFQGFQLDIRQLVDPGSQLAKLLSDNAQGFPLRFSGC